VKSRRPYLLRAMHEWISESDCTPHIVVDASIEGVEVPRQYVRDGKIVLNLSWNATQQLVMGSDKVCFNGRFGATSMTVSIPIDAVLAVYARETGQGMIFADDESGPPPQPPEPPQPSTDQPPEPPQRPAGRAKLKVVK